MSDLFAQLKTWYLKNQDQFKTWFSNDQKETDSPAKALAQLPPKLAQRLKESTQTLPTPEAITESIQEAFESAIEQWQKHPLSASNSLVIVFSPIQPGAAILTESLKTWQERSSIPVRLLQWVARPEDPGTIRTKLLSQLGRGSFTISERKPEIVFIPDLSWCFLRCCEGLKGIEYLRETALEDHSRFWLIGAGQIGWTYLHYTDKVKAYFEQSLQLPTLDGEQLQAWLAPIVAEAKVDFSREQKDAEKYDRESAQEEYFAQLAAVSDGISSVAAQLFLRSLHYQYPDEDAEDASNKGVVKASEPTLPTLPELSPDEHYLLYSLLLHGEITLPDLATSLGDDQAMVRNLVQVLRQQGVIEQENQWLCVNPLYYPKLKDELDGNNFLITGED